MQGQKSHFKTSVGKDDFKVLSYLGLAAYFKIGYIEIRLIESQKDDKRLKSEIFLKDATTTLSNTFKG